MPRFSYHTDGTITGSAKYIYAQADSVNVIGNAHPDDSRAVCIAFEITFDEVYQLAVLHYRGVLCRRPPAA